MVTNYSGWKETTGQDDTHEIDDTFEIDDYSDISRFFDELFGEHDVFPRIAKDLDIEEKDININLDERLINIKYDLYDKPSTVFSAQGWVIVDGVIVKMYYKLDDNDERVYGEVV